MNILKNMTKSKMFSPLLALFLILLVNFILQPSFFVITMRDGHFYGQLIDILNRAVPVMILAMGMTLVIATGGTDLSVGAIMVITGALAIALIRGTQTDPTATTLTPLPLVIIIPLLVGILCGIWNGFLVAKIGMQAVVATLILMVAGRGIAQNITHERSLTTTYAPFAVIGQGYFLGLPITCFIALGLFLLFWFFTRRTAFGLFVESVGINKSAANYAGIRATLILIVIYTMSGLCASISGVINASNIMVIEPMNAGLNYELDAILAVVLGGTSMTGGKFNLGGSCIGAIILMALTKSMFSFGVAPELALVVKATVVVIIVLVQSPITQKFISSHLKSGKREVASA